MQTSVQKQDSVRFGSGVCERYNWSGWVNIGMIKDANMEVTKLIKQFIGANAKMRPKAKTTEVKFNFNLYEIDLSNINLLNWDGTLSSIAWSSTSITGEALGTGWTLWTPIKLANKNGNNTEVSSIVIDADTVELTNGTDYDVYVSDWTNGELGYTYIVPITAQAWVLDADYEYTPNTSKTLEYGDADQYLNLEWFRFTNTNADWKIFRVTILKSYNSEWLNIAFQGDEDEDPAELPVSITAYPDDEASSDSVNLFKIYDEQSII